MKYIIRNKTTEVTEGHREGMFGIAEYIHEEVAFVEVNYARLLNTYDIVGAFKEVQPGTGYFVTVP